jgi:hypothetical protein
VSSVLNRPFFFLSLTEEQYSLLSLLFDVWEFALGKERDAIVRTLLLSFVVIDNDNGVTLPVCTLLSSFVIICYYLLLSFIIDVWEFASGKERDAIVRTRKLIDDERSRLQQECVLESLLGGLCIHTYVCMYVCMYVFSKLY